MHYYVINSGVVAFSLRMQTLIQLFMTVNLNIIGKPLNLNKLQASLCYSIINYRLEKMLKETDVVQFMPLSRNLSGRIDENNEKKSEQTQSQPRFKPGTPQVQVCRIMSGANLLLIFFIILMQ
jgi:hypothetical protein